MNMFGTPVRIMGTLTPEQELGMLRAQVKEHEANLERLRAQPLAMAMVLKTDEKKTVLLGGGGQCLEVRTPARPCDGDGKPAELRVGTHVHVLNGQQPSIVDVVSDPLCWGKIERVTGVLDPERCLVGDEQMGERMVLVGLVDVAPGDRVVLDSAGVVVLKNLGKKRPAKSAAVETGVCWDDVGGLALAKEQLREALEGPKRDEALYRRYGRKPAKGALLCGPPGCGKTLLGKAAATALAELHGRAGAATGFVYVKGPEVLNMFVGKSEGNVRELFERARLHREEHGYPAVVFLDEADALLARRGGAPTMLEGMERTIVPTFLAEMDGLEESGAFVLVATNRPEILDEAVTRDGRLDLKIHVTRPNREELEDIFAKHLRGRPLAEGWDAPAAFAEELHAERHVLYMVRAEKGDRRLALGRLATGAMAAAMVDRACSSAMKREKAGKGPAGLAPVDVQWAAEQLRAEQLVLDHAGEIAEFVKDEKIEGVRGIEKSKP